MLTIAVQKAYSQNVVRNGNTFVQVSDSSNKIQKDTPTMTKYFYIGADGKKYPIYVSSKGKYFIIKTSKKTGKEYKQYLPEVTKQLNGK